MLGPRLGFHQAQTQSQQQRLVQIAWLAARADALKVSDDALETRLARMVQENPALRWKGRGAPRPAVSRRYVRPPEEEGRPTALDRWSAEPELVEGLASQFRLERTTDEERLAGFHLLGNLDQRGFLASPIDEIAESAEVSVTAARRAQQVLMLMEPEGCGADDLLHYLTWQVQRLYSEDPFFPDLVAMHLDDLKDGKHSRIAKAMDMDEEDVEEYAKMLREIPPFPTYGHGDVTEAQHVSASFDVVRDPTVERWVVAMHEPPRTRVTLDPGFESKLLELPEGEARDNARKMLEEARRVVAEVEDRHSLLKRVAEMAVQRQQRVFREGFGHMQLLTMTDVALQLGVHRSSISRVVAGRYYSFQGETRPLRELFNHRGGDRGGRRRVSTAQLHAAIAEIIATEDPKKPFSDARIHKLLKQRGIHEAPRTVRKHRALAGFGNSRERKQKV